MNNKFYITTPIYYSNAIPHIGNAYASFIADSIATYKKLQKVDMRFSTGVDENSQKVVESAEANNMDVMQYADMMAGKHREVWDALDIRYTDFIRTTEPRHHDFVQKVLQKSFDNGDIYEGVYEWLYCVGCEAFKKETDLVNGFCPDHPGKPLSHLKEKNYFFKLSKYQDQILKFYEENPDFVKPRTRFNEIIEFVKGGLEDFSISRETNKFGIPLPFDTTQVTYVWYDALFNYLTVVQDDESKWWTADVHVIGKDIVKFHGIYWPAMLWSAGYDAPKQLLTTGFFTVDGQKMSKTIGNVINPVEYCEKYSRDMLVLYLFSAFPIGEDGDFSHEQAILMYNAKLSNNLGNLLNRFIALSLKLEWKITWDDTRFMEAPSLGMDFDKPKSQTYKMLMENYDLKWALDFAFQYASEINKYVDDMTPWKISTETDEWKQQLNEVLFHLIANLRRVAIMLLPFFDTKMRELLERIGTPYDDSLSLEENLSRFPKEFFVKEKWEPLYMRLAPQ
jgi:methionyl-tRNA synthetase